MNVHSAAPTDPDAFLRWNEGREGKRELVNGSVVEMMVRVTLAHGRLVTRLMAVLIAELDSQRFDIFASDVGIRTPAGVRYPDVVVDSDLGDAKDLAVRSPVFVCEVLSESSVKIDLVEKLAEYTGIDSVQAYLVLSQDAPRAWLWTRTAGGWADRTFDDLDASLRIPALDVEFPLRALYPRA